jgi:hypothetical protein
LGDWGGDLLFYNPDSSGTQRLGTVPDVYIALIIKGNKSGCNKLLDKEVEIIMV